jgi:hypothetical protein
MCFGQNTLRSGGSPHAYTPGMQMWLTIIAIFFVNRPERKGEHDQRNENKDNSSSLK